MTTVPSIKQRMPYLGCDPELFIKVGSEVVGSEHFISSDKGLALDDSKLGGGGTSFSGSKAKVIVDGVQAELNPRPNTCRANLANELRTIFKALDKEIKDKDKNATLDFSQSINISPEELGKLDEKNQKFGCMPSYNAHQEDGKVGGGVKLSEVDATKLSSRSAGGHIHISFKGVEERLRHADEIVGMFDIICGNTCVLVDRNEGNKIRRKLYGRAGEYRLPPHGLEYRTLSNFWLKSYPLMSLAFGLARLAFELSVQENTHDKYYREFTNVLDLDNVQKAINENDFDLAYANFKAIEPLLKDLNLAGGHHPFSSSTLPQFHYFVNSVNEKGIDAWFPDDPLKHWTTLPEAHDGGFNDFLRGEVSRRMKKK